MAATNSAGLILVSLISVVSQSAYSAVLPEDRADVMYHSYSGGGVTVDGPSILIRKGYDDKISASANYYVDTVSSASIDVVSTASEYAEERTEYSFGMDYLLDKTVMGLSYTSSQENDYDASSIHFNVSQDFFGDLSTLTMGYSLGADTVGRNGDDQFEEEVDRKHYRVGLTQIITKSLVFGFNYEAITDTGYLNNPYRQVRYLDGSSGTGFSYESEVYPETRTSDSVAYRAMYYLPYRAATRFQYRYFTDDWDIKAHTYELSYSHPIGDSWMFDFRYRHYQQESADFYDDLFMRSAQQNFMARDKELSTFEANTFGFGLGYQFPLARTAIFDKGSINFSYDHIEFDYEDFRDVSVHKAGTSISPGEEPLYSLSADVLRIYFSIWY